MRKIKNTCLIAKMKTRNRIKSKNPKMAVCITMYNEDEKELKNTLTGVIYNYNELRNDESLDFKKDDFIVFLICDGYDRIPDSFKKYATEKNFFSFETLRDKNFLY
jgi:Chitin synthase